MRLFRRTNSIRQALDANPSSAPEQTAASALAGDPTDFDGAHLDLDSIEQRLARIRDRQQQLFDPSKPQSGGSLEQLDLRMMIELTDDNDEDFERRFGEFAASSSDDRDRSRRWMEKH